MQDHAACLVHAQLACFLAGGALECQLNERAKLCRLSFENGAKPHPGCKAVELTAPSLTCSRCNLCQLHIYQPGNDIMAPWPDLQETAALIGQSNYQQGRNRSDARSDHRPVCRSHFWTNVQGWTYSLLCCTQDRQTTANGRPSPLAMLEVETFMDLIQHRFSIATAATDCMQQPLCCVMRHAAVTCPILALSLPLISSTP